MPKTPSLFIDVIRGTAMESSHLIHALIMDGDGKIVTRYGSSTRLTYPRSSLKPLQALAMVECGAAEDAGLSNAEIALACASHSGEEKHTSAVASWLARIGFDEEALECGAHPPYGKPCEEGSALHNNCSGKHAGMLTLAKFLEAPARGYTLPQHPVQQKILSAIGDMCGKTLTPACCGIDGCSAPNPAMPLKNLAAGFARFMRPDNLGIIRGTACRHIFQAMIEHPDLVGGTGRMDTVLMTAAQGKIASKGGAEGVFIALIPGKDRVIALKAEDGAARASHAALHALLEKHKLADDKTLAATRPLAFPAQKNWRGLETGRIEARFA
ncbi:MAG: asparaginase [Alphaproteobacteria bacterium]|nr:asparaginase [Alphaproteobacteria bacterium]